MPAIKMIAGGTAIRNVSQCSSTHLSAAAFFAVHCRRTQSSTARLRDSQLHSSPSTMASSGGGGGPPTWAVPRDGVAPIALIGWLGVRIPGCGVGGVYAAAAGADFIGCVS